MPSEPRGRPLGLPFSQKWMWELIFSLTSRRNYWYYMYIKYYEYTICITYTYICDVYIYISEKAMASHSDTLAWKIPWTEEPGGLQSMGSLRVRHDWATSLSLFTFMHWRKQWQPTPVLLPGESQGWGRLMGCHLWGRTESDMTEAT